MAVIADLIRNPVLARHWMPDVETPDLIRGRHDSKHQLSPLRSMQWVMQRGLGVLPNKGGGRRPEDIRGVTHCVALGPPQRRDRVASHCGD